jgi:hypothetical protein
VWKHELHVEQNAPTTIPPCPSWWGLPEGHDYTGTDGAGEDLIFARLHSAFEGKIVDVSAEDHNHFGEVTVGPLELFIDVARDYSADDVRAMAAELVEAVNVHERITS